MWMCVCVCVRVCVCGHMNLCVSVCLARGQASSPALPIGGGGGRCSCVPLKEQVFMSPPQVSGLVAMAMPQQKEACVWGRCRGEEEDKGREEKGALLAPHTLDFSLA